MKCCLKNLLFLISVFYSETNTALADNYPKNLHIDILHYKFELLLSDDTNEIRGVTTITLLFKKEGLDKLRLDFVNQTDALKGKGMIIESVYENDRKLNYTHANNELWIFFSKASTGNNETKIIIHYHGIPADGLRIGRTKYGDRSFFNENWPNRARHWLPTVDHPYEKATSEFIVKAPAHYQVITNGLLLEETNLDSTTKLTHWKQSIPVSSWLYVLGVAEFAVQYVDSFDGKSIQTWVYGKDRDAGFYDFAEPTKQVVAFFSDYVGPYEYEKIANVQSPSVQGGMETSSAIFYGEELVNGKRDVRLRNVVIHELAHQWFGNAVTESTWDDAWLSEGFATYFTMLFIEQAYGKEELESQLQAAKKATYDYFKKDSTYKIIDDRSPEKGPVTNVLTYQKGAWVLHMLRNLIGDQAFKEGIRAYYKSYMNGHATTSDFRHAMEKFAGLDLNIFFNQWLYQGGNIVLAGSWKYNKQKKQVIVTLMQTQAMEFLFDFPIEIGIFKVGEQQPVISTHLFNSRSVKVVLPVETKPAKVTLDPRTVLLANWTFEESK